MKYLTKIVQSIEDKDLVEFCIHDIDNGTVEKVVCTKESAPMLYQTYADRIQRANK